VHDREQGTGCGAHVTGYGSQMIGSV
jgi:hypothetical protein